MAIGASIEFVVRGIPVSAGARVKKVSWKTAVAAAGKTRLGDREPFAEDDLRITIVYFYSGETNLDVDNIAKPILDAMTGIVYADDVQIGELVVRKTQIDARRSLRPASVILAEALRTETDFVYIRVEAGLDHEAMP